MKSSNRNGSVTAANIAGERTFVCTGMTNFNRCMATVQWGYGKEETVMCYKEVGEVVGESCHGTVESVEKRRVLGPVQEEAVEVVKLGSQGGLMLKGGNLEKEKHGREILYRGMLEESTSQMRDNVSKGKVIEKELTFSRGFMITLMAKGGKLANSIRRESGANMNII